MNNSCTVDRQYLALIRMKGIGPNVVRVVEFFPVRFSLTHFSILVFLEIYEAEWLRRYISLLLVRKSYTAYSSLPRSHQPRSRSSIPPFRWIFNTCFLEYIL